MSTPSRSPAPSADPPRMVVAIVQTSMIEAAPAGPQTRGHPMQRPDARLAGRVLRSLAGRPVLVHLIERLYRARPIREVTVAVSVAPEDDVLLPAARGAGARIFRGAVHDQVGRLAECVDWLSLPDSAVVVRVTGDTPLVDPGYLETGIEALVRTGAGALEFIEDQAEETCAGLSVAFLTAAAVRYIDGHARDPVHRADPLSYMLEHPGELDLRRATLPETLRYLCGSHRLLLQTPEDLALHEAIYLRLYQGGPVETAEVIEFLDGDPVLASLNKGVLQRGDTMPFGLCSGWRAR